VRTGAHVAELRGNAEMALVNARNAAEESRERELLLVQGAAVAPQRFHQGGLVQHFAQSGGDALDVAGVDEAGVHAIAEHRLDLAHRRADHGDAIGQRLQDDERQPPVI
jgi:hypothetical protein